MYIYCLVIPEGGHTGYYYISEMEDIKQGDTVVIPFGSSDREICGEISSIGYYTAENAPYPPARTKRILRKADAVTEYEFLTVLPITHKKKTFGYINTIPEVRIGDYVDVEFRDEIRIARVLDKTTGTITASPENFMGNMKVLRLLDYDNSDFIRFLSDLKPLSEIKGSLYRPEDENDLIPDVADAEFLPGVYRLLKSPRTLSLRSRIRLLTQVNVYFQEKETRNRFCPRLTETAVETFERVYRIRLPEEYKYFITQIADGALGIRGLNVEAFEPEYIYQIGRAHV